MGLAAGARLELSEPRAAIGTGKAGGASSLPVRRLDGATVVTSSSTGVTSRPPHRYGFRSAVSWRCLLRRPAYRFRIPGQEAPRLDGAQAGSHGKGEPT